MLEPSCLTQLGVGPCCFMSSVGLGLLVPEACIEVPLGRSCCMGVARRRKKKKKGRNSFLGKDTVFCDLVASKADHRIENFQCLLLGFGH